jgi:uncharacterized membrane protein YcaP (DUF421 family)
MGDALMEIVVRAAVIFVFLWIITRAVGRSSLGELSTFQLLLYVTMGDLVQQAITQQDYSVTAGILAVSTFALLTVVFGWVSWRFPRTRPLIHGLPLVIVKDGEPLLDAMARERMTLTDLYSQARQEGIKNISDIDVAVLETDGKVSYFTKDNERAGAPETQPAAS